MTESLCAIGDHGLWALKARSSSPIVMELIGLITSSGLNGTVRFNACNPKLSQEIEVPSACNVDCPVAMTGDSSPFK